MVDFSAVRPEECRQSKLPDGCVLGDSRTVVLQSVLNGIKEHGRSSMHAEVCGVLVGSLCWDGGPYLLIDGRIEGKYASHQSGSVTFTSETWDFIHGELASKHPGRIIVGWYHTHPGFGIFLSNMDAFIHENFFSIPWEPAYVFDPQAETDGFFFKSGTELVREDVSVFVDAKPSEANPPNGFKGVDGTVSEAPRAWRPNHFLVLGMGVVLVCCAVAVGVILIRKVGCLEREAEAAKTTEQHLRGVLSKRDMEIRRHQQAAAEWRLHKETYDKEIAGLRITVTTITAERKDLEALNREKQAEVDQLKLRRANLEKAIHEQELQISDRNAEIGRIKTDLESIREEKRQLELRIKEQEATAAQFEKKVEPTPCSVPPKIDAEKLEGAHKNERRWYSWLKFWE